MMRTFTAYVEFDPDTNLYVGTVPGIRGAHSQGATWDELQHNLREVLELCLEEVQPTVPHHPGRDLARPLVREILREIELTPDEFQDELHRL